ncbi:hypothetical protein [Desulfosediminicola sp.]|uniref:hypothetical protein n=1 Tax=Desulfosediminicola sp. TaxID=2886825 RepID=UPI003AF1EFD0
MGTIDTVQCRVLPTHIENENLLNCIYEEYSSRIGQLSPIEMAHFHALCERDLDEEQRELYYAANDIPGKPHLVRRALDLLKLSPAMQAGLHTGALAENSARELLRLKPADRDACFQLIQTLQLGGGKQRRMLMLLRDLAGRNGCTISDFIDSPVIKEVLEHHEMNTPQKAHSLLQQLQKLQSPTLSEAEEQFERWRAQLPLSGNCTIEHSTSFEQDQVTLHMTFENRSGLERALPTINSVLHDPED